MKIRALRQAVAGTEANYYFFPMPREKRPPLPDLKAHNLRKRAEQMRVIAGTLKQSLPRSILLRKAATYEEKADLIEREMQRGGPSV